MRLLHREPDVDRADERDAAVDDRTDEERTRDRTGVFGRRRAYTDDGTTTARGDRTVVERRAAAPQQVRREYVHRPFHFGSVLVIAGGAALAVIGIVALLRGDLNRSWDRPVTSVLDIDHTPLLAAIEVGAGALLVLLGLTRSRIMALFGCVALAVAAAVAAIQPGRLATQYALETWWAWTVAGAAAFAALVLLLPSGRRKVVTTGPQST